MLGLPALTWGYTIRSMVNTFLPFPSFQRSARALTQQHLGRQRTEVVMILRALRGETVGYRHHPATIMWKEYDPALAVYGLTICKEWTSRGYIDRQAAIILDMYPHLDDLPTTKQMDADGELPWWIGWAPFHRSHRSNLFRKKPAHYGPALEWDDETMPYVWPTPEPGVFKRQHSKGSPYYV